MISGNLWRCMGKKVTDAVSAAANVAIAAAAIFAATENYFFT
jgi:hypothetical protein